MENAPLYLDVAGDVPSGGRAVWTRTSDGTRLRIAAWHPEGATATVLLFPGRTEYVEKYGPAAGEFARAGFATLVVDWRGQGLSGRLGRDPLSGHVLRFSDYQHDVTAMTGAADALGLPGPRMLLAHSMGGAIGLRALILGLDVERVAFTAPMWGIALSSALRPAAWALSFAARHIGLGQSYAPGTGGTAYAGATAFDENLLTGDPDMLAWLAHQVGTHPELALGGPSLHWLSEALLECRRLEAVPSPALPCLTLLGSAERVVDPAPIHRRMKTWPGGRLAILPGARHEALMETPRRRARAYDMICRHFTESA